MLRDNCSADLFCYFFFKKKARARARARLAFFLEKNNKINQPSNGGGPGPWGPTTTNYCWKWSQAMYNYYSFFIA